MLHFLLVSCLSKFHTCLSKKKCNVHWSYCCPQSRHSPFSLNLKTVASITWQCLPLSVYDSMALSSNVYKKWKFRYTVTDCRWLFYCDNRVLNCYLFFIRFARRHGWRNVNLNNWSLMVDKKQFPFQCFSAIIKFV